MSNIKKRLKEVTYEYLDILTGKRGVIRNINGEQIRFPIRYARYYESDYETATFKFLRENCPQGGVYLDCGGHIGLFAVVAARRVGKTGRVFSFEPTPLSRRVLTSTVELNNCQDIVEVRSEAVSQVTGTAIFYDTGDEISNANSLVKKDKSIDLEVRTVSLDDFTAEHGLQRIDCLKIDVEGSELDVLRGAKQVIKTFCPAISLGLHPFAFEDAKETLDEIWNVLQDYALDVVHEDKPVDRNWFIQQTEIFDVQCFSKV